MTTTPVGMRCPECARQRTQVRGNPVGAAGRADAPATYALVAVCVAAFIGEIATGGTIGGGGGTLSTDGGLFPGRSAVPAAARSELQPASHIAW